MRDKRLNELNLRPSKLNREDSKKKLNWQDSASKQRKQRELGMRRIDISVMPSTRRTHIRKNKGIGTWHGMMSPGPN